MVTMTGRELQVARIAVEDEVVQPAVGGDWTDGDPDLVEERDRYLDVLAVVGRLGDPRTAVTIDGEARQVLALVVKTVASCTLAERALCGGDDAAEDDLLVARRLVSRLLGED